LEDKRFDQHTKGNCVVHRSFSDEVLSEITKLSGRLASWSD